MSSTESDTAVLTSDAPKQVALGDVGVIIVNSGSPSSYEPDAVESYLSQFLTDPHIAPMPLFIWKRILKSKILPKRKCASGAKYKEIWLHGEPYGDVSPLIGIQDALAKKIETQMGCMCESAMLYGEYRVLDAFVRLQERGAKHIVVVPLYPQSAFATTESVIDTVRTYCKLGSYEGIPCHIVNFYPNYPTYIKEMAAHFRSAMASVEREVGIGDSHLMCLFHSTPLKDIEKGDIYEDQCHATFDALVDELGWRKEHAHLAWGCVFGPHPEKWLGPSLVDEVKRLRNQGVRHLTITAPGFSIDCLETLWDIPKESVRAFLGVEDEPAIYFDGRVARFTHEGRVVDVIPCLNDTDNHARIIAALTKDILLRDGITVTN